MNQEIKDMSIHLIINNHFRCAVWLWATFMLVFTPMCAQKQSWSAEKTKSASHYPDSLSMEVLRHGRISVSYLSYFQASSATRSDLDRDALQLGRLDAFFESVLADTLVTFDRVELYGVTSVDGTTTLNQDLANRRAQALYRFLNQRYRLSGRLPIEVKGIGEDWDGLASNVRSATLTAFPWRDEVLRIIRYVPVMEGRESQLLLLDNGRPYQYMRKNFFPRQRCAVISMVCDMKKALEKRCGSVLSDSLVERAVAMALLSSKDAAIFLEDKSIPSWPIPLGASGASMPYRVSTSGKIPVEYIVREQESLRTVLKKTLGVISHLEKHIDVAPEPKVEPKVIVQRVVDTVYVNVPNVQIKVKEVPVSSSPLSLAIKTNLLALGGITSEPNYRTPMANLALELFLNRRFSIAVSGLYADSKGVCGYKLWSATAYTLEGRYTVMPVNRYSGLFVGLYGRGGDFDIRKNVADADNPYQTGRYYEGGVSAGYSLYLSSHWVIEGGLSGGIRCKRYTPYGTAVDGSYISDSRLTKRGVKLTGLFLNIGYVIGKGHK